jgi:hypothetical protein
MQPTDTTPALSMCLDKAPGQPDTISAISEPPEVPRFRPADLTTEASPNQGVGGPPSGAPESPVVGDLPPTRSLTILIPTTHNPDENGHRVPIENHRIEQVRQELLSRFGGFNCAQGSGRWRDLRGRVFQDEFIRFEIDGAFDASLQETLKNWKLELERELDQQAIYFKLSGPVEVW